MTAATCGRCGSAMRQTFIVLSFAGGCQRIPSDLICTDDDCLAAQRAEDRADRAARDEAALAAALESGLVVPDNTPESERWA